MRADYAYAVLQNQQKHVLRLCGHSRRTAMCAFCVRCYWWSAFRTVMYDVRTPQDVFLITSKAEQALWYDIHGGTWGHQDKWCSKGGCPGT
jgi:hypothetical protein